MLTCNIDSFYFTEEELQQSPSRAHGITQEQEGVLRVYGAQMVQEAGILLKCPQVVMATGQILLQRFYCKRSLKDFSIKKLAAAAVFLACKLEECTKVRVREVVMVFDRLWKRRDNASLTLLEPGTKEYQAVKDSIIRYEREMLRVFGFIVHCDHPHKLLISFVKVLDGGQDLIQEAWNIVNDSLRTPLCVLYKSEVVASGAIYYAARKLQIPLPEAVPWWAAFSVKTEQLVAVVRMLHELYQKPKSNYIHVSQEVLQPQRKVVNEMSPDTPSVPSQIGAQAATAGAAAAGDGAEQEGVGGEENGGGTSPVNGARAKEEAGSAGAGASERAADGSAAGPSISGSREGADREREHERKDRGSSRGGRSRSRERGGSGRDKDSIRDRDRDRGGGGRDRDRARDRDRDRERDRSKGVGRSRSRSRERERERLKEREKEMEKEREKLKGAREREKEKERERSSSRRERDKVRDRSRDRSDRDKGRERESREARAERERERERERELRARSLRVAAIMRDKAAAKDENSQDGFARDASRPPPRATSNGRDAPQRSNNSRQAQEARHQISSSGTGNSGSSESSSGPSGSESSGPSSSGRRRHHRHHHRRLREPEQQQQQQQQQLEEEEQQQQSRRQPSPSSKNATQVRPGRNYQGQLERQGGSSSLPSIKSSADAGGGAQRAESGSLLLDRVKGLREDEDEDCEDRRYASDDMDMQLDDEFAENGLQ